MKILAIRIKNLASLEGEFVIDFTSEPLSSAGIFAISGPTGAGKSTILDAICLALFNRTPRTTSVEAAKVTDVGEESIQQGDERQILRRGTVEGVASVEFLAVDGGRYRSTWHVWRAGLKRNGRLQPVELKIYNQDTQTEICSKIKESENKLKELTGLTYEQFTRTVLLAQNDFARFLKARRDEKAEVLEKLTGTEIYSVISNTVYLKSAAAKADWRQVNDRIENIRLLSDEELTQLHLKQEELSREEQARLKSQEEIKNKIQWFGQYSTLLKEKTEADSLLQEIEQRQKEAQPQEERLRLIESVESAGTLYQHQLKCQHDLQQGRDTLQERLQFLAEGTRSIETVKEKYNQQLEISTRTANTYTAVQPEINRARELDSQIKNAKNNLQESLSAEEEINRQYKEQCVILQSKEESRKVIEIQHTNLTAWIDKVSQHERMFVNINLVNSLLDTIRSAKQQMTEAGESLRKLNGQKETIEIEIGNFQKKLEANGTVSTALNLQKKQLQKASEEINISKIRMKRTDFLLRKEQLQAALTCWKKGSEMKEKWTKQISSLAETEKSAAIALLQLKETIRKRDTTKIRRNALEQAYRNVSLAAETAVITLRGRLLPDAPCPVCGSCHHPFREDSVRSEAALDSLKKEYETIDTEHKSATAEAISLFRDQKHLQEKMTTLTDEMICLQKQREEVQSEWKRLSSLVVTDPIDDLEVGKWLTAQIPWIETALQELNLQEQNFDENGRKIQQIEKETEETNLKNEFLTEELRKKQTEQAKIQTDMALISGRQINLQQQMEESIAKMEPEITIENWKTLLESDPQKFQKDITESALKWQIKQKELEATQKQKDQVSIELSEGKHILETLLRNVTDSAGLRQSRTEVVNSLQQKRSLLLEGKGANETEQQLRQALQEMTHSLEEVAKEREKSTAHFQRIQGEVNQLQTDISTLHQQSENYIQQLKEWLQVYNATSSQLLTTDELIGLLTVDAAEVKTEREIQNRLHEALTEKRTTAKERELQLVKHLNHPEKPDLETENPEQLQVILDELKQETEILNHQNTEIRVELRNQQLNREQTESFRKELETKAFTMNQWGKLDEMIGSASGNKFKEIAQGYTLDLLLSYANRQLQELSQRYYLQRVPGELALQVVDRDMGDEVRSVFSLSGGESFLVSLALALGLSSIASRNRHEESLFIDEGFGSLDAETLQTVMEALEHLRSQGRKVGIISHVREMAEHIPVQIRIIKSGNGKSRIQVIG